jgi:hypothetical protein
MTVRRAYRAYGCGSSSASPCSRRCRATRSRKEGGTGSLIPCSDRRWRSVLLSMDVASTCSLGSSSSLAKPLADPRQRSRRWRSPSPTSTYQIGQLLHHVRRRPRRATGTCISVGVASSSATDRYGAVVAGVVDLEVPPSGRSAYSARPAYGGRYARSPMAAAPASVACLAPSAPLPLVVRAAAAADGPAASRLTSLRPHAGPSRWASAVR